MQRPREFFATEAQSSISDKDVFEKNSVEPVTPQRDSRDASANLLPNCDTGSDNEILSTNRVQQVNI